MSPAGFEPVRPVSERPQTHKRQTFMSPAGFEPATPVSERPQTHALERTATGISVCVRSETEEGLRHKQLENALKRVAQFKATH
jgi:hypothetical protein